MYIKVVVLAMTPSNIRDLTAQKNHISGSLFNLFCGSLGLCFFALNFVNRKMIKSFSVKLSKYWKSFCCYVLVVSTTLKKFFSRCNFSDYYVLIVLISFSPNRSLCSSASIEMWKHSNHLWDMSPDWPSLFKIPCQHTTRYKPLDFSLYPVT